MIRTITFTAKTWQTITEISVICIIGVNVPQLHIYFCDSSTQSFRSAIVNNSCFLSLGSFMCTGLAIFAYWMRQLITFIPQRDESSSFLFTFPIRQTWVTMYSIISLKNLLSQCAELNFLCFRFNFIVLSRSSLINPFHFLTTVK